MCGVFLLANFMITSSPSFTGEVRSAVIQRDVKIADLERLTEKAKVRKTRLGCTGSGFFISADGTVLTNHHVVDGAEELVVVWSNTAWRVNVIASDSKVDLAILGLAGCAYEIGGGIRIDVEQSPNFPFLVGDSGRQCELGDTVYAIGYPHIMEQGMEVKVTRGVISSLMGSINKFDADVRSSRFQMDAAIQAGNSGGPVVDEHGRLVGVCVSGFNASYLQNVNYAIKFKAVREFLEEQRECGNAAMMKHSIVCNVREAAKSSVIILNYMPGSRPLPFDEETKDTRLRNEERARFEKTILYAKLLKVKKEWMDLTKVTDSLINEYGEDVSGGEIKELNELAKKELGIMEGRDKNKEDKK